MKKQWEETTLAKALAKNGERRESFSATSVSTERLYTPDDISGDYEEKLGYPGQYPFTRGVQPTMYRGRRTPSEYRSEWCPSACRRERPASQRRRCRRPAARWRER